MSPLPLDDDQLLEQLRQLAAVKDPVPRSVVDSAKAAFALRTLDEEMADLLFDSLLDDSLVGVRGGSSRQLTFGVNEIAIDLDVESDQLVGQVTPAGIPTLELQTPELISSVAVDSLGRFFAKRPKAGPFRLRLDVEGQRVTTEWVNL